MPVYKAKTPTKDGRIWFFKDQVEDIFGNSKQYVSKKYATKTEAKDAERNFLNEVKDNNKTPTKMTLGDLWKDFLRYQDTRVRATTKRGYKHTEKYIEPLFNIQCNEFTFKQFDTWLDWLKGIETLNNVSKNDKLKVFRALLNYGRKNYDFNFNKILGTDCKFKDPDKVAQIHDIYCLDEFNQFLAAETNFRFRCMWLTLYYCGLRIGELRGLQWKDINWETNEMWINKQVQSPDNYSASWYICDVKTPTSNRKLIMFDVLVENLKLYHEQVKKYKNYSDEFFVFGDDYGVIPIGYSKSRRRKKKIAADSGVKEIRLHDFRHSCASFLIYNNVPIPEISRYMGHASITETLKTYAHMFGSDLSNVTNRINDILSA